MNNLLSILSVNYKDNENPSVFISNEVNVEELKKLGVKYIKESEGTRIDLFNQSLAKVFKTKIDFYNYVSKEDFDGAIVILEDKLCYKNNESESFVFENIKYSFLIFDFIKSKLSDHQDILNKQFIILSDKLGKDIIGYQKEHESSLDINLKLQSKYNKLKESPTDSLNFFKNSALAHVSSSSNQDRYLKILTDFDIIYQNSQRDFSLYQSKFSFSDFKKNIESEKQKYIKETQDYISDLSSKVNLPIQFGVYIFLLSKFSQDFYPLIATLVIILSWSILQLWSISYTRSSIKDIGQSVTRSFSKIKNETKLDLKNAKTEISTKIKKAINITLAYSCVTILVSLSLMVINIYLLYSLCKPI